MSGVAIRKVNGRGVYVEGNDIDTDRIIPARFLKEVTFSKPKTHRTSKTLLHRSGGAPHAGLRSPRPTTASCGSGT